MEILIRAAKVIDPSSPHHNSIKDILIQDGVITKIENQISFDGTVIEHENLMVSPGWFDMRAHFTDPGKEHKEDLESGSAAAATGGFTDVMLLPNTDPVTSNKNSISYYLKWNKGADVNLHPAAAITLGCQGKELTEMIDLHTAGAVAFTDGIEPIWHTDILLKSLQYLQTFDGVLINRPEDRMLTAFGTMHEGQVSTILGMKGMPELAEEVMIDRDLELLKYAGGKIHFSLISSAGAVERIRKAKAEGLNVTADVGVHHLIFTDENLMDYDTSFKVNPPFRSEKDRLALIEGLKDGAIDVIVSDHQPHDQESKQLEFDLADFGIIGLQTFYPALLSALGNKTEDCIERVTAAPRKILGIDQAYISEGGGSLTIFSPSVKWNYNGKTNKSKSVASPFFNQEMMGKVVGIVNNGRFISND
ncbi:dihydroorotase [Roseivirga sp.]|uniref:dihydroorotase n=1 Tax=Roseivirga sp. TaxID=1964215 RepID=UPI002B273B42|nr:dihydroorotase [Roseivirga sp.]